MFRYVWCLVAALALVAPTFAQVALPDATPVSENFDSMAATLNLPANWRVASGATPTWAAGTLVVTQQASSGAPTAGGTYNWGAGTSDRAVGSMTSGSFASPRSYMVNFQNTSAQQLDSLTATFQIERYRVNTAAAQVNFFWSSDGSTWNAVTAGDVLNADLPTGASAYNFAPGLTVNRNNIAVTFTPAIPPGGQFYLRWNFNTTGSSSQGIGLDDVSVTGSFSTPSNNYSISPVAFNLINQDDVDGNPSVTAVVTALSTSTITGVNLVGSGEWAYTGTATPFVVNGGTTAALTFQYSPDANTAIADITTATVTSSNLPASVVISLSGNTVKEVPLAQFKSEAEAGTAGSTVYKITNGIVSSSMLAGTRNQFPMQDEATGSASTRGVWVDDVSAIGKGAGTIPTTGSTMTVWGTYTNNRGLVQLVPTKLYQVTATGATLVPYSTSGAGIGDSTEGVLITVPNTIVPAGTYNSSGGSLNVTVSDGTSFVARLLQSAAISYTGTGLPYPMTGVAGQFTSSGNPNTGGDGYQVFPRSSAEVPVELSAFDAE